MAKTMLSDWTAFRKEVDRVVSNTCGLGLSCLADVDIWDYFPEGRVGMSEYAMCVEEAACWVLDENSFPYDKLVLTGGV